MPNAYDRVIYTKIASYKHHEKSNRQVKEKGIGK